MLRTNHTHPLIASHPYYTAQHTHSLLLFKQNMPSRHATPKPPRLPPFPLLLLAAFIFLATAAAAATHQLSGVCPSVDFTKGSLDVLERAIATAKSKANAQVSPLHLAACLFDEDAEQKGGQLVAKANVPLAPLRRSLASAIAKEHPTQFPPPQPALHLQGLADVGPSGGKDAERRRRFLCRGLPPAAGTREDAKTGKVLKEQGLTLNKVKAVMAALRKGRKTESRQEGESNFENLNKYGRDLVADAEKGKLDPVIDRDAEIRRVVEVLSRRTKNNPILLGEPGVGKTAIVEGLALRTLNGDIPKALEGEKKSRWTWEA